MKEIERKFLFSENYKITDLLYVDRSVISDIYPVNNVRFRNVTKDDKNQWYITIKSKGQIERNEFEWPIECEPIYDNVPPLDKIRFVVPYLKQNFEINLFKNIKYKKKPLILVEIELKSKEQKLNLPDWIGEEVTNDERFYGFALANFLKYKDFEFFS